MSYEDSVQEALCHGWIDSIIQRVDENSYARKFTPRTDHQNWSELNKRRIAKLIREGRMTEHGLAKIGYENPDQEPRKSEPKPLPLFMQQALKANPTAWENFNRRPPSHKKSYILWVLSAKREETRERRMKRVIEILVANKRLEIDAK